MDGVNRQQFERRRMSKRRRMLRRCSDCGERIVTGRCTYQRVLLCPACDQAVAEAARMQPILDLIRPFLPSFRGS